ncbi:MAG: AAA family ATPase, partial [Thermodesulfobacteriota bacterium]
MIVNELELGPFAGITEKMKIAFDNGLNVILGRNEAGKSTFVKALISAFFLQISPGKNSREYKEELKPLFPHPDGDTINVCVRIDCNGETYQLKKTWGENPTVELRLPNGNRISNETRVGEKLDEIMVYGSETYRNILISRQADMARTIESLKSSSEATNTLGEALRRTMFEADGVSVDALKERIKSEVDDLLNNWDIQRDCSKDDKRWKKGVGKVLEAFYKLEDQKKTLIKSREAEEDYLKISNELKEVVDEIEKLSQEVGGLKSIAGDIQRGKEFEPKLELLRTLEDKLKKANREWPVADREMSSLESSIRELTGQKVKLETELVTANAAIKSQSVRDLFNKIEPIYERVQELEQQINELPNIRRENLKELGQLVNEVDTCKAKLSAGKLSGGFSSKEPMNLIVQEDLDDPMNISVEAGGEVPLKAGSQIIIESENGWKMELHSGKQDI